MKQLLCILALLISLFTGFSTSAAYTRVDGTWTNSRFVPSLSAPDHYDNGFKFYNEQRWDEALNHFLVIVYHYQLSPFYADALFYSGVCYFFNSDFDFANKQFNQYLLLTGKLKYFEKVFEYKYQIAEYFRLGRKRHPWGISSLPKWASGKSDALTIYEEINVAMPSSELATSALFKKGELLRERKQYKEAIEAFQTITKRFPKHYLATESFLMIADVYLEQSCAEPQNPDLLSLGMLNLHRFQKSFPGDERIENVQRNLVEMQEIYANSLFETGRFYEKKKKYNASLIYYQDTIRQYPQTKAAKKSKERVIALGSSESYNLS